MKEKKTQFLPEKLERITACIVAPLGDTIMSLGAVQLIRAAYPKADIDFIVSSPYLELFEGNGHINTVSAYSEKTSKYLSSFYKSAKALMMRLHKREVFFCFEAPHSFMKRIALYSGIPYRISPSHRPAGTVEKAAAYCNLVASMPFDAKLHMLDYYQNIVRPFLALDPDIPLQQPLLHFAVAKTPLDAGKKTIALCFEGSERNKHRWPVAYQQTLMKILVKKGYKLLACTAVNGGKHMSETAAQAGVELEIREGTVLESAKNLSQSALLISIDCGQIHLASALNIPTISIASRTTASTHPSGKNAFALSITEGCGFCSYQTGCAEKFAKPEYSPHCMLALPPELVAEYAVDVLEQNKSFPSTVLVPDTHNACSL